jgi:ATP-binding cassette subfamily C protein CydC
MISTIIKTISLGKEYKYWMLLAVFLGFLTIGSGIGLMMTSAYLISKAALQTPIYQLQVAIVGVRFFGISRGVFRYLERLVSHNVTFKLLTNLRVWFFRALVSIVPSKTTDLSSGDLLTRSIEDIENLEHIFVRVISPPFIFLTISVLMFSLLNLFSLNYALLFLILFFLSAIGIPFITYLMSNKLGRKIVLLKSRLKELSIDTLQGFSELTFYNQYGSQVNQFEKLHKELVASETKMSNIQSLHETLTGLMMNVTVILLLITAIPDVTNKILDGVFLSVISIGIMAAFEAVISIPQAFQYLSKSSESAKRLFDITNQEIKNSEIPTKDLSLVDPDLVFNNISFSYQKDAVALKDVSFKIKQGNKTAIVGASGAGKSTIVNLITKLWEYDSGDIYLGNINYRNINEINLRNLISVVPQKVHLFTGTIKENLLIAKPNATGNDLIEALTKVDLSEFVNNLPEKLNTNIGELGKKLSGGESKRLSIARALLQNNPILIFDEITSHVDNITEQNILNTIANFSDEKTVLFITHRLNKMEMFDNILVLQDGRLIAQGNHKELLKTSDYYLKLISAGKSILEIS